MHTDGRLPAAFGMSSSGRIRCQKLMQNIVVFSRPNRLQNTPMGYIIIPVSEVRKMDETVLSPAKGDALCCSHRKKARSDQEIRDLLNRLSRIEGQIRGIRGMVEKGAYCPDILTQVAAANAALGSFTKVLLANHIRTCVARDIREGRDETIDELVTTLQKLMR